MSPDDVGKMCGGDPVKEHWRSEADGDADVVTGGTFQTRQSELLENDGRGFFRLLPGRLPSNDGTGRELLASDLDLDGDQDLLVSTDFVNLKLWRNDGGRFQNRPMFPPGYAQAIATATSTCS